GLENSTELIATRLNNDTSYTDEGRDERFTRHTREHHEHLDKLTQTIDKIIPAAEEHFNQVKANVFPTPTTDDQALVAEMQASRILSRPGMTDPEKAAGWVRDTPPSPARTAVMEELVARGVLDSEHLDGLIEATSPGYIEAKNQHMRAQTLVNSMYRPRLNAIATTLNNRRAPLLDPVQRHDSSIAGELPQLNVGPVPGWTPNNAETVYRNQ
ncbi:MAG: hypothetical protein GXX79_21970, partial [Actinomycetales bacterium]|nr:hypothetical protein [Actinomycetales bacterium]